MSNKCEINVHEILSCWDWEDFLPARDPELQLRKVHWIKSRARCFYSYLYLRLGDEGHPAFINAAKNDKAQSVFSYNVRTPIPLASALRCVYECFMYSLPRIAKDRKWTTGTVAVCIVPRAKREEHYHSNQLGIKFALQMAIKDLANTSSGLVFRDATDAIKRVKNVVTTHGEFGNFVASPTVEVYDIDDPDFMRKSCRVDCSLWQSDYVLLVDDIYTAGNPIDSQCLALILEANPKWQTGIASYSDAKWRMALYVLGVTDNSFVNPTLKIL